ncbi:MAG TPA: type II secretion system F family protein [Bdellovibrionota bacterium]|nr:type II secretion system F family protein [Bdellovibrionota bacterium]
MAVYKWEGITRQGVVKKGEREAPNQAAVVTWLRQQQVRPKAIVEKKGKAQIGLPSFLSGGVKEKDIVIFARQFATMIDAGLPLVQCLEILASQQESKKFKAVLYAVKTEVEGGSTFAEALRKHPKVFDELFVNLVAAGEVGGILDTIFLRLANYLEKSMKLKKKVKGAMVYPTSIMIVASMVVTVLLVWVIPVFENMFREFGNAELPVPTQIVIKFSRNFKTLLIPIIIFVSGIIFGIKYMYGTKKGRLIIDSTMLKAPVFGPLLRKVAVARFTRTLSTMITSGVPLLDALDIVAKAAGNKVVENAIQDTRASISEGKTMAEPLEESGVFPSMVCQMISVGEATGAMDAMLNKIADFYDDEVDSAVDALTALMEPAMMVFLGVIIGGLVVAMYLPVFKLAGTVGG